MAMINLKKRVLRVFDLARTLRVTTDSILDHLESKGYNVSRRQMQPVSAEMFEVVLRRFAADKVGNFQAAKVRLPGADEMPAAETEGYGQTVSSNLPGTVESRITKPDAASAVESGVSDTIHPLLPDDAMFAPPMRPPKVRKQRKVETTVTKPATPVKSRRPIAVTKPEAFRLLVQEPALSTPEPDMKTELDSEPVSPPQPELDGNTGDVSGHKLNNLDLALLNAIISMSVREKLALLKELM